MYDIFFWKSVLVLLVQTLVLRRALAPARVSELSAYKRIFCGPCTSVMFDHVFDKKLLHIRKDILFTSPVLAVFRAASFLMNKLILRTRTRCLPVAAAVIKPDTETPAVPNISLMADIVEVIS